MHTWQVASFRPVDLSVSAGVCGLSPAVTGLFVPLSDFKLFDVPWRVFSSLYFN